MATRLKFFISGRELELDNERATVIQSIEDIGFIPISSENRPASSKPISQKYPAEIRDSDVYIGIFGKCDSKPSREEYEIARKNNIPTLVFAKNLPETEKRDEELTKFLDRLKHPESGITIDWYFNTVDLEKKIMYSISELLTEEFYEKKRISEKNLELEKKLSGKEEEKLKIRVTRFILPKKVKLGIQQDVIGAMNGTVTNGFLDLMIRDPDNKLMWFPDPESYDTPLGRGKLKLSDESYERMWPFTIPKGKKTGKYLGRMLAIEDKIVDNKSFRNIIDYEDMEFMVKE